MKVEEAAPVMTLGLVLIVIGTWALFGWKWAVLTSGVLLVAMVIVATGDKS